MSDSRQDESTLTENGAISYGSTQHPLVDFFFKSVRGLEEEKVRQYVDTCYTQYPLETLKLLFHIRDCRTYGKGERQIFHTAMRHLIEKDFKTVIYNLENIAFYGSYKDYLKIFPNTLLEQEMVRFYCKQLKQDTEQCNLDACAPADWITGKPIDPEKKLASISLAGKYAPSEHSKFHYMSKKFARHMGLNMKEYRKYLTRLRSHLKIAEQLVCSKRWSEIEYDKLPSLAMKRYSSLFKKYDTERYQAYLNSVTRGEAKINTSVLYPHEIIGKCATEPDVADVMWNDYVRRVREKGILKSTLVVVDTSGSMSARNIIDIACALGILFAEINQGSWSKKFISFSSHPELCELQGSTIAEKFNSMKSTAWEMNTNLEAVFSLVLTMAKTFNLTEDQMPKNILIVSDMQFDSATESRSNLDMIEAKYSEAGYTRPRLIFWNLAHNTIDFPATVSTKNTVLISGFAPSMLDLLMSEGQIDPLSFVMKVLNSDRYSRVTM